MAPTEGVPPDVRLFLDRCIDSVEQLEVLLMLWRGRPGELTASAITRDLGSNLDSIRKRLQGLVTAGLAETGTDGFRFHSDATHDVVLEHVAHAYRERRVSVITYIINSPDRTLRAFSDAFRLRDPRSP